MKRTEAVKSLIEFDERFLCTLSEIRTISHDERLDDTDKVERIRTLLEANEAVQDHAESEISALKAEQNFSYRWNKKLWKIFNAWCFDA